MIEAEPSFWHRVTELPVLLSLLTFLTLVATWLRTSAVDRRNRKWAALDLKAAELAKKIERDRIAREQRELQRMTHRKIDENTAINVAALASKPTIALIVEAPPPAEPIPEGPPDAPDSPPRDYE